MVKQMDYEYDAYGDYDVYHDGSYNMGPTYNRDDLKTVDCCIIMQCP